MAKQQSTPTPAEIEAAKQQAPQHPDSEIYADGVLDVWLRMGVLKIDLYQTIAITPDNKGEYRRLSQRLSLPLAALSELKNHLQGLETAIAEAKADK